VREQEPVEKIAMRQSKDEQDKKKGLRDARKSEKRDNRRKKTGKGK